MAVDSQNFINFEIIFRKNNVLKFRSSQIIFYFDISRNLLIELITFENFKKRFFTSLTSEKLLTQ